jgi:hypothetical protein
MTQRGTCSEVPLSLQNARMAPYEKIGIHTHNTSEPSPQQFLLCSA